MKRTIRFQTINILLHNNKHSLNARHRYKNDLKRKHNWKCGEIVLPHACVNGETEWVGETGGGGQRYSTADEYFCVKQWTGEKWIRFTAWEPNNGDDDNDNRRLLSRLRYK